MTASAENPPPRSWWRANQQRITPILFLAPGILMFGIYVIWPIFESFRLSLYDWDGLGEKTWVAFGNYAELWRDRNFWTSLENNIIWLVLYMLAVPGGLAIALFLNQTVRGIRIYKSLFFFPFVISQVVVGLIFAWFYAPNFGLLYKVIESVRTSPFQNGLVTWLVWLTVLLLAGALVWALLGVFARGRGGQASLRALALPIAAVLIVAIFALGFWLVPDCTALRTPVCLWEATRAWVIGDGDGIAILAEPKMVTYGIIAAGLWPQVAYCMILYLTGLNNVAPDQVEAARLDGAKGFRMLWFVILPQLRPATFIAVVVTVIGALRSFDLVSIMTGGGPFGSSRVLSFYMYQQALSETGYRMGYGAAIAVILFAIMMVFISGFIWKMVRDEKGV
jgi:multiple sugar transport system permease protein